MTWLALGRDLLVVVSSSWLQVDLLAVVSANVAVLVLGDQSDRATEADVEM